MERLFKTERQLLYESQQSKVALGFTMVFFVAVFFFTAESHQFDFPNPFGLPGAISQYWIYLFGFTYAVVMKKKRDLVFPWHPIAAVLWVVGLTLATLIAAHPEKSWPQPVALALYFLAGYGIWKAACSERVLGAALVLIAIVGMSWSVFIVEKFFEFGGSLPHRYIAYLGYKGSYNHHVYGLLIVNGACAILALISKKRSVFFKVLTTALVGWTFFAIFISQSRASFVCFAVTCSYILLKNETLQGRGQKLIKVAWVFLTLLFIFWTIKQTSEISTDVVRRFDFGDEEYQMQKSRGRPEMFRKGLILISKNPLGIGGYNTRFTSVGGTEFSFIEGYLLHNQYLTTVVEGGWILIITWIILVTYTVVLPFKEKWKHPARLGMYCCWLNFSVQAVFAETLSNYYLLMLFLASAAISLEVRARAQHKRLVLERTNFPAGSG